jgi:hypothetical protein
MRIDYPSLEILHARARRERAQAMYELLIAPIVRLFHKRSASAERPALRSAPLRSRLA